MQKIKSISEIFISLDICPDSELESWYKNYETSTLQYMDSDNASDIYSKYSKRISVRDNFYSYIRNSNSERVLCIIRDFRDRMRSYLNEKMFDLMSNVEMDRMHSDVNRMMSILFMDTSSLYR